MGAVAEGSPSIRAQANLSALGLHEMAASLPDYVRMCFSQQLNLGFHD